MSSVEEIDPSALQVLKEVIDTCGWFSLDLPGIRADLPSSDTDHQRGVSVYMTHLGPEPLLRIKQAGIAKIIGNDHIHDTVKSALDHHHA